MSSHHHHSQPDSGRSSKGRQLRRLPTAETWQQDAVPQEMLDILVHRHRMTKDQGV